MPGHYETQIKYKKLKREDRRAFNTAVDMQVEADAEEMNRSLSDKERKELIKKYEANPQRISDRWYMATFQVYKSKDFSDYIEGDKSSEVSKKQQRILKKIDESNEEMADDEIRENRIMDAASEQAKAVGKENPDLNNEESREELWEYYMEDPGAINDDILEDNELVRTDKGYVMSFEEVKAESLDEDSETPKLAKDFPNRKPNRDGYVDLRKENEGQRSESYLDQADNDQSKMNTNGPGKGWHGERMRHRDAALGRTK